MVAEGILDILVHPLVLLNISDYYTRLRLISDELPRIAGVCLGTQDGRQVSVENSFEILLDQSATEGTKTTLNHAFLEAKLDQYKQVFPNFEAVGWYTIGNVPSSWEESIQAELSRRFESPLMLLLLDPELLDEVDQKNASDLPLKVFESQMEVIHNEDGADASSRQSFHELDWKLETSEAERIAVDHVAKAQSSPQDEVDEIEKNDNSLISHYNAQANAIKMLSARIALLKSYVEDVHAGKVSADHNILRRISALLHRLPLMQSSEFSAEFKQEQGDVLLVQHLNELMKGTLAISNLIDTYPMMMPRGNKPAGLAGGWM